MMNKEEIMQFLPHREPMLLVDQMEMDKNKVAHGRYIVKGTEYFLQGHFPDIRSYPASFYAKSWDNAAACWSKSIWPANTVLHRPG